MKYTRNNPYGRLPDELSDSMKKNLECKHLFKFLVFSLQMNRSTSSMQNKKNFILFYVISIIYGFDEIRK